MFHYLSPDEAFDAYVESHKPYIQTVKDNGGEPWFSEERRPEFIEKLGLTADATETDLRRAMFLRRHSRPQPPNGMKPIQSLRSYQKAYSTNDRNIVQSVRA